MTVRNMVFQHRGVGVDGARRLGIAFKSLGRSRLGLRHGAMGRGFKREVLGAIFCGRMQGMRAISGDAIAL